jgi:hypothetical protein
MRSLALGTAVVALAFGGFVLLYTALQARPPEAGGMRDMGGAAAGGPAAPPVKGFADGQEIRFIHTEASDPQITRVLTDMMQSPVLLVPSLAQAPEAMRANVYVFTNGIKGDGPLGFQPDVFDSPPGTDGYRPLRTVNMITWSDERSAREVKAAAEVQAAAANGEVTLESSGAVVNMPFLSWPGGHR